MQFFKNLVERYILDLNVPLYLLISVGLVLLLEFTSSFWHPKLVQLNKSFFLFKKEWFYYLFIAFAAFLLFTTHAAMYGLPVPANGDEYSYLLMAKTFAAGRITNPPHPLWQFFDNFHLLNQPTYTGKYPPIQAAFLALGIIFFNQPIVGVWISGVLAALICFWMLRTFFSANWSLIGTLLTLTQPTIFQWNYGYYYGNTGLIGGCLCIGSLFRLIKTLKIKDALIFALGISILANSRPFEGLLACLPLVVIIVYWIIKHLKNNGFFNQLLVKFILPAGLVLLLNFIWMGYYNWRVTGSFKKLPYSLYTEEYDPIPLFLPVFSTPNPDSAFRDQMIADYLANKNTRNPLMKIFHINEIDVFYIDTLDALKNRSSNNVIVFLFKKFFKNFFDFLYNTVFFYVGILLFGFYVLRQNPKYLFFILAFMLCMFLEGLATYNQNHYYSPFVPYFIIAVTASLALAKFKLKKNASRRLVVTLSLSLILLQTGWLFVSNYILLRTASWKPQNVFQNSFNNFPDKHLIVIDYATGDHQSTDGRWIFLTSKAFYNEPDMDSSKAVWATSLGQTNNRQLFDYFPDRHVWILGFETDDPFVHPKLLSCENLNSEHPPSLELENVLRNNCPQR